MKVTIRIHRPTGLEFKTKKIDNEGKVLLQKRRKGKQAEWRPKVTGLEIKHKLFGRVQYFADVFPDALETWTPNYADKKIDTPELTKKQIMEFADWEAMRARFRTIKDGGKPATVMYIILIVQIVSLVIQFLISSGRLRL